MKTDEARLRPGGTMASLTFGASFQRRARLDDVEAIFKIVETYARRGILLSRTAAGDYVIGRRLWDIGLLAPVQAGLVEVDETPSGLPH